MAGACAIAFSGALVKLAHVSATSAAVYRCAYALPVLGALALVEHRRLGPRAARDRALALGAGAVFAVDLMLWHRSIADIGAGLATVLGNLQVAVVPLVAWLVLGDRPTRRVGLAIALAAVGVVLLAGVLEHGAYGSDPTRGALLGIACGVAYSGYLMLFRAGSHDVRRLVGPLFDVTVAALAVSLAAGVALDDLQRPSWPAHGWLAALALSTQVVGWLLVAAALPRLPSAVSSVLLTIQPVGAVLLGVVIFGEVPSLLQLAGVITILATLVLVLAAQKPAASRSGGDPLRGRGSSARRAADRRGAARRG